MAWEPIEVTEEDIRAFAAKALEFAGSLDEHGPLTHGPLTHGPLTRGPSHAGC